MNGDLITQVKDGPFLDKKKDSKAASGKQASGTSPKAAK